MKIKKHGDCYNKDGQNKKEKFTCKNCGCEFTADEDEIYVDYGGANCASLTNTISVSTYTWCTIDKDYYVCSCPECHKICKNIHERKSESFSSPSVTYTTHTNTDTKLPVVDKTITVTCDSVSNALGK